MSRFDMLLLPNSENCYVWPSWATMLVQWSALPSIFENPLGSGLLDPNDIEWLKETKRFPPVVPPLTTISGPANGGVIIAREDYHPSVLFLLLSKFATYETPQGMPQRPIPNSPNVTVLEDFCSPNRKRAHRDLGRHYCQVSVEHVDDLNGRVYWMIEHASPDTTLDYTGLFEAVSAFPIVVRPHAGSPRDATGYMRACLRDAYARSTWIEIESQIVSVNVHFAMMIYSIYHLRSLLGNAIRSASLVAEIEGTPNFRKGWLSVERQREIAEAMAREDMARRSRQA